MEGGSEGDRRLWGYNNNLCIPLLMESVNFCRRTMPFRGGSMFKMLPVIALIVWLRTGT